MRSSSGKTLQRRHMEAVVAVGEHLSVHRAARSLGMPQPVLSRMLAEAEAVIGIRLFDRSSHGSTPTPQGAAVLARARVLLRGIERLGAPGAGAQPTIRLGCIPRAMGTLMPRLLARMHPAGDAAAPEAPRVRIEERSSRALFEALAAGSLDFAVLRPTALLAGSGEQLVVERLYDDRTVVICAAGNAAIPAGPVPLARLSRHDWVLPEADTASRAAFDEFLAVHGLARIRPILETRSSEATVDLIPNTRLLSIAPFAVARRHEEFGSVRIVPLRRAMPANPVMLAYQADMHEDPLLERFRDLLQAAARELKGR